MIIGNKIDEDNNYTSGNFGKVLEFNNLVNLVKITN